MTSTIDLLVSGEKGLEVLDFKIHSRPEEGSTRLTFYEQQLYLYAYALHRYMGQFPQRLLLYWTAEKRKEDALMEVPYHEDDMKKVIRSVHETVTKIRQHQFEVKVPPHPEICKTCDVRRLCKKEGMSSQQTRIRHESRCPSPPR